MRRGEVDLGDCDGDANGVDVDGDGDADGADVDGDGDASSHA